MKPKTEMRVIQVVGWTLAAIVVLGIVFTIYAASHDADYRDEECRQMCVAAGTQPDVATYRYGCLCADGTHFRERERR